MLASVVTLGPVKSAAGQWSFILPEQRRVQIRRPDELPPSPIPKMPRPPTVANPQFNRQAHELSLDQAIRIGLENSEVVRVLAGVTAASSGRTIYDVAITNTTVDSARSTFDPTSTLSNDWTRNENPAAIFDPADPMMNSSLITGTRTDNANTNFGLQKQTSSGGTIDLGVTSNANRFRPGSFPLNPENRSAVNFSYTQPLLQGGGTSVNRVPIVLARINTERSFFQYKDSMQNHIRGIVEAYWNLVFARTDLWARQQQVAQASFANQRTEAALRVGDANIGEVSQTRVALENFRATLLDSQANVLQREAALRNILGLAPYSESRFVPMTPPNADKMEVDWDAIVRLAVQQRPDIIELKLVLEADEQQLLVTRNQANPRLDAVGLYQWNGLDGRMPSGMNLQSRAGQFGDWNMAINFSVPLTLRRERAALRQQELIIARDKANLHQGVHQAVHFLALSVRNLEQFHQRYRRFQAVRKAAKVNLDLQMANYFAGNVQFVTVLQAIVDWGNAVSSAAQTLTLYNTELATLERETGSILESHGVAFAEERFSAAGPLGRFGPCKVYPVSTRSSANQNRYSTGKRPSENFFDLRDPLEERRRRSPRKRRRMLRLPPVDTGFESAVLAQQIERLPRVK